MTVNVSEARWYLSCKRSVVTRQATYHQDSGTEDSTPHNPVTGRVQNAFAVLRDGVHEWRWHLSGDMGWKTQETHDAEWRHSPEANWIEAACHWQTHSATFMEAERMPNHVHVFNFSIY